MTSYFDSAHERARKLIESPDTADFREAIAKYDAGVARTTAELEKG